MPAEQLVFSTPQENPDFAPPKTTKHDALEYFSNKYADDVDTAFVHSFVRSIDKEQRNTLDRFESESGENYLTEQAEQKRQAFRDSRDQALVEYHQRKQRGHEIDGNFLTAEEFTQEFYSDINFIENHDGSLVAVMDEDFSKKYFAEMLNIWRKGLNLDEDQSFKFIYKIKIENGEIISKEAKFQVVDDEDNSDERITQRYRLVDGKLESNLVVSEIVGTYFKLIAQAIEEERDIEAYLVNNWGQLTITRITVRYLENGEAILITDVIPHDDWSEIPNSGIDVLFNDDDGQDASQFVIDLLTSQELNLEEEEVEDIFETRATNTKNVTEMEFAGEEDTDNNKFTKVKKTFAKSAPLTIKNISSETQSQEVFAVEAEDETRVETEAKEVSATIRLTRIVETTQVVEDTVQIYAQAHPDIFIEPELDAEPEFQVFDEEILPSEKMVLSHVASTIDTINESEVLEYVQTGIDVFEQEVIQPKSIEISRGLGVDNSYKKPKQIKNEPLDLDEPITIPDEFSDSYPNSRVLNKPKVEIKKVDLPQEPVTVKMSKTDTVITPQPVTVATPDYRGAIIVKEVEAIDPITQPKPEKSLEVKSVDSIKTQIDKPNHRPEVKPAPKATTQALQEDEPYITTNIDIKQPKPTPNDSFQAPLSKPDQKTSKVNNIDVKTEITTPKRAEKGNIKEVPEVQSIKESTSIQQPVNEIKTKEADKTEAKKVTSESIKAEPIAQTKPLEITTETEITQEKTALVQDSVISKLEEPESEDVKSEDTVVEKPATIFHGRSSLANTREFRGPFITSNKTERSVDQIFAKKEEVEIKGRSGGRASSSNTTAQTQQNQFSQSQIPTTSIQITDDFQVGQSVVLASDDSISTPTIRQQVTARQADQTMQASKDDSSTMVAPGVAIIGLNDLPSNLKGLAIETAIVEADGPTIFRAVFDGVLKLISGNQVIEVESDNIFQLAA